MTGLDLRLIACVVFGTLISLFIAGLRVIVGDWLWCRRREKEIARELKKIAEEKEAEAK